VNGSGLWHAEHAWIGHNAEDVLIKVENGRIKLVTEGVPPPAGAVRLRGWTIPGLANVHSHAFQRWLRGEAESRGDDFWQWREMMFSTIGRWDPDTYREYATVVFREMLEAGITAVGEFHYLHHYGNRQGEALIAAAREVGIRITLLDACYLRGGLDGSPLEGEQQTFSDGTADQWAARVDELDDDDGVRIGAAIHSVRAVDPRSMRTVAAWARNRNAPLHIHLAEQPAEVEECLAVENCTPTQLLEREGVLGPDLTAVHAIHVTDADVALLGRHHVSICSCSTTERDLGDRVGPIGALVDAGSPLCVGSDSNVLIDALEEARGAELDQRRSTGRRVLIWPTALFRAITIDGMRALGWEAGELKPGRLADFVTIGRRPKQPTGIDLSYLIFCCSACDVNNVVVGGKTVVAN